MPIKITAKREGFRRCGIAHSENTTTYPDGHFTRAQLAELEAEPNLVVIQVADVSELISQQDELVVVKARVIELENVVLQLNADAVDLKASLYAVTAERDDLSQKLAQHPLPELAGPASETGQTQDGSETAADDAGSADDKKPNKKKD